MKDGVVWEVIQSDFLEKFLIEYILLVCWVEDEYDGLNKVT